MKAGDQVTVRKKVFSQAYSNLIETGFIVSIQGSKAIVSFPASNTRRAVSVTDLEAISKRYPSRSRVQLNPIQRRS